mgnify:CR=1 FL=1
MKESIDVDDMYFPSMEITEKPKGEFQGEGEWCDQSVGYCGDDFTGTTIGRWTTENISVCIMSVKRTKP